MDSAAAWGIAGIVVAIILALIGFWWTRRRPAPARTGTGIRIGPGVQRTQVDENQVSGFETGIDDQGDDTKMRRNKID